MINSPIKRYFITKSWKYYCILAVFLLFSLGMAQDPTPPSPPNPTVVVVTQTSYSTPPPVVVTKYVPDTEPTAPPAKPSTTALPPASSNKAGEGAASSETVVFIVCGIAGGVLLVAIVAFILRRIGRRNHYRMDPDYPPVLNAMSTPSQPASAASTSPADSTLLLNNHRTVTPLRSHESEAVFLKQLNEP